MTDTFRRFINRLRDPKKPKIKNQNSYLFTSYKRLFEYFLDQQLQEDHARINYPRINSGACSSHSVGNSDLNAFRLSPVRLHHRTVDDARLSAKIYSADACLLNCGASSPLRYSVPKNWMFIDASRSSFDL